MTFVWPSEDGWPYPDSGWEDADVATEPDDDLLSLRLGAAHLLDDLDPLERHVIAAQFGLNGAVPRTMSELHAELGLSAEELAGVMGSGLTKLRNRLA